MYFKLLACLAAAFVMYTIPATYLFHKGDAVTADPVLLTRTEIPIQHQTISAGRKTYWDEQGDSKLMKPKAAQHRPWMIRTPLPDPACTACTEWRTTISTPPIGSSTLMYTNNGREWNSREALRTFLANVTSSSSIPNSPLNSFSFRSCLYNICSSSGMAGKSPFHV
jgi:hypothetical protein